MIRPAVGIKKGIVHLVREDWVSKVRKCKLSWKAPDSDQVVGYRLYWSKSKSVSYDSSFFDLGNVTEVYLPEVLKLDPRYDIRVMLGITAVDIHGNESDMVTLPAPYQTIAPPAPENLLLTKLDEFSVIESHAEPYRQIEKMIVEDTRKKDVDDELLKELARMAKPLLK